MCVYGMHSPPLPIFFLSRRPTCFSFFLLLLLMLLRLLYQQTFFFFLGIFCRLSVHDRLYARLPEDDWCLNGRWRSLSSGDGGERCTTSTGIIDQIANGCPKRGNLILVDHLLLFIFPNGLRLSMAFFRLYTHGLDRRPPRQCHLGSWKKQKLIRILKTIRH